MVGSNSSVIVYADGGSRGNPGPAGYGAVVFAGDGRTVLAQRAASVGRATNNVAEYSGLIAGLEAAGQLGAEHVAVRMDSKLVVEQMSGRWQVKHPDMKPLAGKASRLLREFASVTFEWVPRAQNSHADRLANEAMDAAAKGESWGGITDGLDGAAEPDLFSLSSVPDPAAGPPDPHPSGATTVLVVRHGETTWGAQGRFAGRQDVPLTERGRRQADSVSARIAPLQPAVVLTSPLQRCRKTATAIAGGNLQVIESDGLIDGALGEWTGLTSAQIAARWPEEFAQWRSNPDIAPPGGETFNEIRLRVRQVLLEAARDWPGQTIVLVTHAAITKMLLAAAMDVPSDVAYRLRIDTASLSGFTMAPGGAVEVWAVNETGHLPV